MLNRRGPGSKRVPLPRSHDVQLIPSGDDSERTWYTSRALRAAARASAISKTGESSSSREPARATTSRSRSSPRRSAGSRRTWRPISEPSPDRVDPPCPYFGSCGGCQWQHVSYSEQLRAKTRIVADALEHIGGFHARESVRECVPSPKTYGYRNKIELVPAAGKRLELGFHRHGSDEVLPIERCLLLPKAHEKAPARLAGALRYASGTQDLGIRRVGLRVAANTSDVEVALWTAPSAFPRTTVASTLTDAVKASSVVRVIVKELARGMRHPRSRCLRGGASGASGSEAAPSRSRHRRSSRSTPAPQKCSSRSPPANSLPTGPISFWTSSRASGRSRWLWPSTRARSSRSKAQALRFVT